MDDSGSGAGPIIGGGMHDDRQEPTGPLLGEVLDLVDRATGHLTPDYIEDRLQQILAPAPLTPDAWQGGPGSLTVTGEGTGPAPMGEFSLPDRSRTRRSEWRGPEEP
ncbi:MULTISPECIES: hypothetical protein [Thermomonosporaceae]|uniref:hypothetical protein n=1 Tax=Thermomonosporaceae TaxID=2012 RepID=UPI00255B04EF|nr:MULTISPECIES: hypothetical protein [Thermomonosporaceae]MDL4773890.1 hypothetical protein [Actinomadura xylanilytica]